MTRTREVRAISSIILAIGALSLIGMFAVACNTTQSPNRQVSDVQITTQVKAKLASDVRASSLANIEVNTTNGVVTLSGQVESAEVKQNAENVTAAIPGVVRVNNNLQIESSAASAAH